MSDEQPQQPPQPHFSLQKFYVKDLSFETPNSPLIFRETWEPEMSLQISNSGRMVGEGVHEVVLTVTVTAKINDKTAYLVEVQQAGIFNIAYYDQDDFSALVGVYCPNVLFPYAREVISDLVTKGGFPQFLLAPVNFEALYAQHMERLQQQQSEPAEMAH